MPESRRKFDRDFKEGAVRLVRETGRSIAQIAKDLDQRRQARWLTGWPWTVRARTVVGGWTRMSALSWPGCGGRMRSWPWSVMCSSARSPSGSRTRWAGGSRGRVHRYPEGRVRSAACGGVPGAGGIPGLVLQVAPWRWLTAAAGLDGADRGVVRPASGHLWRAEDHRGPDRDGLAGQPEHRRGTDGRARAAG